MLQNFASTSNINGVDFDGRATEDAQTSIICSTQSVTALSKSAAYSIRHGCRFTVLVLPYDIMHHTPAISPLFGLAHLWLMSLRQ